MFPTLPESSKIPPELEARITLDFQSSVPRCSRFQRTSSVGSDTTTTVGDTFANHVRPPGLSARLFPAPLSPPPHSLALLPGSSAARLSRAPLKRPHSLPALPLSASVPPGSSAARLSRAPLKRPHSLPALPLSASVPPGSSVPPFPAPTEPPLSLTP